MQWMLRAIQRRQQCQPSQRLHARSREPQSLLPSGSASDLFDNIAALNPQLPPPKAVENFDRIACFVTTTVIH
ncbi:MAG: hypothetical protein AAFX40_05620 [Cyanobacteria bacterium J06639_1]